MTIIHISMIIWVYSGSEFNYSYKSYLTAMRFWQLNKNFNYNNEKKTHWTCTYTLQKCLLETNHISLHFVISDVLITAK